MYKIVQTGASKTAEISQTCRNKLQYDFVIPEVKEYEIVLQQNNHNKKKTCTSKHLILENTWTRYRVWPWIKSDSSLELLTVFDHLRSRNFLVNTQNVSRNQYPALMKWAFFWQKKDEMMAEKPSIKVNTRSTIKNHTPTWSHPHAAHKVVVFADKIAHKHKYSAIRQYIIHS